MTAPAKPADNLAEQEHQKTVFDMTTSEFEAACQKAIANRSPGPVKDYVVVIDENDRIVKEFWDGRVEYIQERDRGDDVPISQS